MAVHESREDYLETILLLSRKQKDVHSVEVAREMGVSKPAITKAMKILVQEGYVAMDGMHIRLTEEGEKKATEVYEKHTVITRFLVLHGVSEEVAEKDACRMEHIVSDETFTVIKDFVEQNE
ncbi:MAG: metal-dependent transcriptional regulator [Clostridia bacterium]|nr:metal-dependent transcriptional regulator [Clostridia bacterium]